MRKIDKKNYIYLTILIIATVLLTLVLADIYKNKTRKVSELYEYSNTITAEEIDSYLTENSDTIIYISDKYNNEYKKFESNFEDQIEKNNLKDKLVYLDKNTITKKELKQLKKDYNIDIDLDKCPMILIMIDKKVFEKEYINDDTKINLEVFE